MQSSYGLQSDLRFCRCLESKRADFEFQKNKTNQPILIISTLKVIKNDFQGRDD